MRWVGNGIKRNPHTEHSHAPMQVSTDFTAPLTARPRRAPLQWAAATSTSMSLKRHIVGLPGAAPASHPFGAAQSCLRLDKHASYPQHLGQPCSCPYCCACCTSATKTARNQSPVCWPYPGSAGAPTACSHTAPPAPAAPAMQRNCACHLYCCAALPAPAVPAKQGTCTPAACRLPPHRAARTRRTCGAPRSHACRVCHGGQGPPVGLHCRGAQLAH